ncbi:hypothetical protein A0U40_15010 [[Bacillus] sp. KCTC 13219]|nr:hypothetical protein A0U40_15010 [[Bacillus] sp. KCTC 13219]
MHLFVILSGFIFPFLLLISTDTVHQLGVLTGPIIGAAFIIGVCMAYIAPRYYVGKNYSNFAYPIVIAETTIITTYLLLLLLNVLEILHILLFSALLVTFYFLYRRFQHSLIKRRNLISIIGFANIFIFTVGISNFIYLQRGLETVYHNLLHYFPAVVHWEQQGAITIFCIVLVYVFLKTIVLISMFESKFSFSNPIIIGLIGFSLILTSSTMTLVAITDRIPYETFQFYIIHFLSNKIPKFYFIIFSGMLIISIISSFLSNLLLERPTITWLDKQKIFLLIIGVVAGSVIYYCQFNGITILSIFIAMNVIYYLLNFRIFKLN